MHGWVMLLEVDVNSRSSPHVSHFALIDLILGELRETVLR